MKYFFAGFVLGGHICAFFTLFWQENSMGKAHFKHFVRRCLHDTLADHFMRAIHENLQWWSLEITIMNAMIAIITIMAQRLITTMTNSHYGGNLSVMMMVGICQWQNPTIDDDDDDYCKKCMWSCTVCIQRAFLQNAAACVSWDYKLGYMNSCTDHRGIASPLNVLIYVV